MSEWEHCPNRQECTEGNRFGKGCVEDPLQNAMGGKPWHECRCGVDADGNPPNLRQTDTITALRTEVASKNEQFQQYARKMETDMNALAAQNEQMRAALEEIVKPGGADGFWECVEIARSALEEKQ